MVATLAALKVAVSDELRRANDLTFQARLDRLVLQAEQQIDRDLRVHEREGTVTLTTQEGAAIVPGPTDMRIPRSLTLPGYEPLGQVSPEAYDRETAASMGLPKRFAVSGSDIWFGPVPDGEYAFRLRYWKALPRLSVTDAHPAFLAHWDVWFYATMLVASPGLVDDERVLMWGKLYEGALAGANALLTEGLANSMRPARIYGRLS